MTDPEKTTPQIIKRDFEYSSPIFEREWQRLEAEGWSTIYVDAQMCNNTTFFYRAIGVKGARWRYWYGGGYDVITHDPDFIIDDLQRNSPDFTILINPAWPRSREHDD